MNKSYNLVNNLHEIHYYFRINLKNHFKLFDELRKKYFKNNLEYEELLENPEKRDVVNNLLEMLNSIPTKKGYSFINLVNENNEILKSNWISKYYSFQLYPGLYNASLKKNEWKEYQKIKKIDNTTYQISLTKLEFAILELRENIHNYNSMQIFFETQLIYIFSIFEAFNKDFLNELLAFKPDLLYKNYGDEENGKCVEYKDVFNSPNIEKLREKIIEEKASKISLKFDRFEKFLKRNFKFNINEYFTNLSDLKENLNRRHIIVHNFGKMDSTYIKKTKPQSGIKGDKILIKFDYMQRCYQNVDAYMFIICRNLIGLIDENNEFYQILYDSSDKTKYEDFEDFLKKYKDVKFQRYILI